VKGLNFPKTMRWKGEDTFSRPMRWLLAMHGGVHSTVLTGIRAKAWRLLIQTEA